jgi:pullulanase
MKYALFFVLFLVLRTARAQVPDFASYPVYHGKDLGLTYSPQRSLFRIWSPPASRAELVFYANGTGGEALSRIEMKKAEAGTWTAAINGDQKGKFYVFRVFINGSWLDEVPDPYAKLVGVNGKRAVVGSPSHATVPGWDKDVALPYGNKTDAIIYELHIRDASIHANSGIKNKGKFLGLTETGTKNPAGLSTGIDHIRELGVTHVHLLPFYDFFTVDESKLDKPQYNWGYDPLNYNTPEGSYSTNPSDGITRIKELKQLVRQFHQNGLRVVMDAVYNHTMFAEKSYFNQLVPGYYYRQKADGTFSDATACGNETASERPMMRKFIIESATYWAREFHLDGFRFDLMGVHDIETMNLLSKELHRINPHILLYGEGWTAGACPLPDSVRALKRNAFKLDKIAVFSDDIRDGIKGSVFDHKDRGFASGKPGMEESIRFGIVAATQHPQVNYSKVNYSKAPYAKAPHNTISYCECHDNHVLWDKLAISASDASEAERREMHKLSLAIVLTSQGISFLHAGTEFLRSKGGNENSFNSGDSVNAINWELKSQNNDVYRFVRGMIELRKKHPAFRMTTSSQIAKNLVFDNNTETGIIAYSLNGASVKDSWSTIYVVFNGNGQPKKVNLPAGAWNVFAASNEIAPAAKTISKEIAVAPYSCSILFKK